MIQFNLWGGEAQEPQVVIGGIKCFPKRIEGKIRLVTPSGWVLPEKMENLVFRPLKNGGMQFAIPSEIMEARK